MWFQEKGVWMSFPIADMLSVVVSLVFVLRLFKKFDKLKDGQDAGALGSAIK